MDIDIEELKKLCNEALEALITSPLLLKQSSLFKTNQYDVIRSIKAKIRKTRKDIVHIRLIDYAQLIMIVSYHQNYFKHIEIKEV